MHNCSLSKRRHANEALVGEFRLGNVGKSIVNCASCFVSTRRTPWCLLLISAELGMSRYWELMKRGGTHLRPWGESNQPPYRTAPQGNQSDAWLYGPHFTKYQDNHPQISWYQSQGPCLLVAAKIYAPRSYCSNGWSVFSAELNPSRRLSPAVASRYEQSPDAVALEGFKSAGIPTPCHTSECHSEPMWDKIDKNRWIQIHRCTLLSTQLSITSLGVQFNYLLHFSYTIITFSSWQHG
jgi:hypothetical protein